MLVLESAHAAEATEAFGNGHVRAFRVFGGAPCDPLRRCTKLVVGRILGNGRACLLSRNCTALFGTD